MWRRGPCLLALLLAAAAVSADSPVAVDLNERGIADLLDGRPGDAVATFERALQEAPQSRVLKRNLAAALAELAEQRRRTRDGDGSIRLLDRAIRLHPERLRYRVLLGRARFESDRDELRAAAREDFLFVLEHDADHLDALVNLGQIAYTERKLAEAARLWAHALRLRPGDQDIAARLAKAERERDVERSFQELSDAYFLVRYSPTIPLQRVQEILALCQQARGELSTLYQSYPPRIVVTLYTSAQFQSATRMHGWVAGLSDGTIRLTVRRNSTLASLRATIYHELTHHIIRGIAPRAPVWLHEGIAQMEEGKSAEGAEARLRNAGSFDAGVLSAVVLRQADARKVSLFYDVALAFARYLRDSRRGSLQDLLRELGEGVPEGEAIRALYGRSRDDLFDAWHTRMRAR